MFELEDVKQFLIENEAIKQHEKSFWFVNTSVEDLIDLIANFTLIQIEKEREKILNELKK